MKINKGMALWVMKEIKSQIMRFYFSCLPLATMRIKFLRKHKIFAELGEGVHWQPRTYPIDAKRIKIHNNVAIATNVLFVLHDISWMVLEKLTPRRKELNFIGMKGCCEIYDNVFIGANVLILPDVAIGPNAVIAAGAVVTRDVPPNTVVAGVPAKVIGSFEDFVEKRAEYGEEYRSLTQKQRDEKEWENFYKMHLKSSNQ